MGIDFRNSAEDKSVNAQVPHENSPIPPHTQHISHVYFKWPLDYL